MCPIVSIFGRTLNALPASILAPLLEQHSTRCLQRADQK